MKLLLHLKRQKHLILGLLPSLLLATPNLPAAGTPPVAVLQVRPALEACPTYYCDPYQTTFFVLAHEGAGVPVELDASASFDPEQDPLIFQWAELDDGEHFFSTAPIVTQTLFESIRYRVYVRDGLSSTSITFHVTLITPETAMDHLLDAIDELVLDDGVTFHGRSSLDELIHQAIAFFTAGDTDRAIARLEQFEKRIASQSRHIGAIHTRNFIKITQSIINVLR